MKKLLILGFVIVVAVVLWQRNHHGGDTGTLEDLRQRLDAAEASFQQAGRAAGMSGADTSAGAESAVQEVERVEHALHELERETTSEAEKREIANLLVRVEDLKRRMG